MKRELPNQFETELFKYVQFQEYVNTSIHIFNETLRNQDNQNNLCAR